MTKKELKLLIRECINEVQANSDRGQMLRFKAYKKQIIEAIENAIKNKNYDPGAYPSGGLAKYLYLVLRTGGHDDIFSVIDSFSQEERKRYIDIIRKKFPVFDHENPSDWSQVNINTHYPSKSGKNVYNYYVTIEKTRENIIKYMDAVDKHADELRTELESVSNTYKSPIRYKTLDLVSALLNENDSFKVFYNDRSMKTDIVKVVDKWFASNGVKTSPRTHSHGYDTDKESYGAILSKNVAKEVMKWVSTFGTKYTPEQYYQFLVKNFVGMISTTKIPDNI